MLENREMLHRHIGRFVPWAAAFALAACDSTTLPPQPEPPAPPPAQVRIEVAELGADGVVGELTQAPVFRVSQGDGSPAGGVTVTFAPLNGGSLQNTSAVSDENGLASPGQWELGPRPGLQWVSATAIGPGVRSSVLACETAPCPPPPPEPEDE